MKLSFESLGALSLGALFFTTVAQAHDRGFLTQDAGFYWWIDAGATIPEEGHLTEFAGAGSGQTVEYDAGMGLNLAAGYAFNKYLAAELQFGGTWNAVDSIEGADVVDSYFTSAPILANVVLQYPIPQTRLVPYVGAGAGGAATVFDTDGFYQTVPGGSVTLYGSDSDFVFAWQAFAGLRIMLNDRMSVGVAYHYFSVDDSSFSYESPIHGEPDLNWGISEHRVHMAAVVFQMKF